MSRHLLQQVTFNWDPQVQGILLGAFFYGFEITQIISGIVVQKVGGKLLILIGLSWMSLLTLLTPIITTVGGFGALFTIRLFVGLGSVRNCRGRFRGYIYAFVLKVKLILRRCINRASK